MTQNKKLLCLAVGSVLAGNVFADCYDCWIPKDPCNQDEVEFRISNTEIKPIFLKAATQPMPPAKHSSTSPTNPLGPLVAASTTCVMPT